MAILASFIILMMMPVIYLVFFAVGGPLSRRAHPGGGKSGHLDRDETDLDVHSHFPESDT
jgi:hypothetical protein